MVFFFMMCDILAAIQANSGDMLLPVNNIELVFLKLDPQIEPTTPF